jgi:AAA domain
VGLVWVTGNSGTGKSTVRVELARRGYSSFDTDEDGITAWRDRITGKKVEDPGDGNHPDDWLARHAWMIDRSRVEELALRARDELVFLCGSVENEDEVWDLFEAVICLVLDEQTLKGRIASRTSNDFGKKAVELEAILSWNPAMATTYRDLGCYVLDADQSLDDVVAAIIAFVRPSAWGQE